MPLILSRLAAERRERKSNWRKSLRALALWARPQAPIACAEIAKGLAIVSIGDMIVADEIGELVAMAGVTHSSVPYALAAWPRRKGASSGAIG